MPSPRNINASLWETLMLYNAKLRSKDIQFEGTELI